MIGLLAEFTDPATAIRAAELLRAGRLGEVETHTPYAPEAAGASVLPLVVVMAGVTAAAGAFLMQWYATAIGYPLNIGGRPNFAWPAFVPMAFETGILVAVATGVIGFLIACRLPALYDPVDEADGFRRASRDGFFVDLRAEPEAVARARSLLAELSPRSLAEYAA